MGLSALPVSQSTSQPSSPTSPSQRLPSLSSSSLTGPAEMPRPTTCPSTTTSTDLPASSCSTESRLPVPRPANRDQPARYSSCHYLLLFIYLFINNGLLL